MRTRSGSTLIEMVVLMTALSVVLTLTVVTLHRVMRAHNRSHAMHADESAAWRLSTSLRRDLAKSAGASLEREDDSTRLTLLIPFAEPIHYRFGQLRVTREQRLTDDQRSLEEFSFGGENDWEVLVLPEPQRVAVRTRTDPSSRTQALAPIQIDIVARLANQPPEGDRR